FSIIKFQLGGPLLVYQKHSERVNALIEAVRYIVDNEIRGALVECGVWKGGSVMAIALALKELGDEGRELYLYDTFSGMSAPTAGDVSIFGTIAKNEYSRISDSTPPVDWCLCPLKEVKQNVFSTGYPEDKIHFVEGKVETTIPQVTPSRISLLRLDTDWYESTKHELIHLFPLVERGGVMIVDDYGHWAGAKRAVDEYIQENNLCVLLNRIDYTGRIAVKHY
ncbi:MAG: TylF/MycF/NovP-related O-methyltransferase, partial [bacterium]